MGRRLTELERTVRAHSRLLERGTPRLDAVEARLDELDPPPRWAELPVEDGVEYAVVNEIPVVIAYRRAPNDVARLRTLSPYEVYESAAGDRLVRGFDHDREELRSFRLDRTEAVVAADAEFVQAS